MHALEWASGYARTTPSFDALDIIASAALDFWVNVSNHSGLRRRRIHTNLSLLVVMVEFIWTSFVKKEKLLGSSERYTSGGARGSKGWLSRANMVCARAQSQFNWRRQVRQQARKRVDREQR
jgi:hypothetical protein